MLPILNTQAPEKQILRDDGSLDVYEIFDTMQGEGPFAGTPATFVRLAGCQLACSLCDTQYTGPNRKILLPHELLEEIEKLPKRSLVVLTGGEPLRQDFYRAAMEILQTGRKVQVETNGGLFLPSLEELLWEGDFTIVCSPKTPKLHTSMWSHIDALKYVVQWGQIDSVDGLPLSSVGPQYGRPARPPAEWKREIYVQPLDEKCGSKNRLNTEAAVQSCMRFGYRLCLQVHKLVGLE